MGLCSRSVVCSLLTIFLFFLFLLSSLYFSFLSAWFHSYLFLCGLWWLRRAAEEPHFVAENYWNFTVIHGFLVVALGLTFFFLRVAFSSKKRLVFEGRQLFLILWLAYSFLGTSHSAPFWYWSGLHMIHMHLSCHNLDLWVFLTVLQISATFRWVLFFLFFPFRNLLSSVVF